jgi:hypothetical protein
MKICFKKIVLAVFLLISFNGIHSQTAQTSLDQVELMKQFIGTWKCEYRKDTFLIIENAPFGTGMVSNSQIVTKGDTLDSIKQLYGYDKEADKYIMAELVRSSSVIEICNAWFTSGNAGELVVTNTENARFNWRFEFKTPNLIIQTAILDGKVVKEVSLTRMKSDL